MSVVLEPGRARGVLLQMRSGAEITPCPPSTLIKSAAEMASIYTHHSGYKIRYYLYFPDGTKREACRYSNNRQKAQALKEEAAFIEASTRRGAVTYDELVHYKHQGFISDEDISRLAAGGRVAKTVTWGSLKKHYERFSRAYHSAHNHKTSMSRLKNLEKHFGIRPIAHFGTIRAVR